MWRVREFVGRFLKDPLGTAIEAAIYLIFLGVGLWILIWAGKWIVRMIADALK